MDIAVLLTAGANFILFLILHVVLLRLFVAQPAPQIIFLSIAVGFFFGLVFFFLVTPFFVVLPDSAPGVLYLVLISLVLYGLLVLQYIAWIFGMGEAAIRIRILLELEKHSTRGVSLKEIYQHYNGEQILKVRLARLVNSGHLTADGNC